MLSIFANRTYRHLFAAQVIALIGTGLATVALGLLAFDLAGNNAGVVMGTALAIKMIAYVGLATVALGLLAFDLAGNNAGVVMGTALAIKMIAYVGVAPIAAAFAERLPKHTMLVTLDVVRAGVALLLPFVSQIWEVYVLIFVLQAASAAFTPCLRYGKPDQSNISGGLADSDELSQSIYRYGFGVFGLCHTGSIGRTTGACCARAP